MDCVLLRGTGYLGDESKNWARKAVLQFFLRVCPPLRNLKHKHSANVRVFCEANENE